MKATRCKGRTASGRIKKGYYLSRDGRVRKSAPKRGRRKTRRARRR